MKKMKVIISGGGTGGHIFPAVSIANELKRQQPDVEILFVGAEGKMEMEKVPSAGYKIEGLPIRGFQRKLSIKTITFFYNLLKSMMKARRIVNSFNPDVAVGVGGYASGPTLRVATKKGIPSLVQEQNSYAGVTNRILGSKVQKICVAYEGMETYFPAEKIVYTGNPVRQDILDLSGKDADAAIHFGLDATKPTILVIGGSLGARAINEAIFYHLEDFTYNNVQLIWQTGKSYFPKVKDKADFYRKKGIVITEFIKRMDYAYALANIIVSRAGAGTISELALVGKPVIFVPSPNVSEDHQTKNAMALVNKKAAVLIKEQDADLISKEIFQLFKDVDLMKSLGDNIKQFARPDAAKSIVAEILKLAKR